MRGFWQHEFPAIEKDAVPPVTNLLQALRASPALTALLGSSHSTFDIRGAIDAGQIVLVCPGAPGGEARLIANLLVFDLVSQATRRGEDIPRRQDRRPFLVVLDELQGYDGAVSGSIAEILEQLAEFGVVGLAMNQDPNRLTDRTLKAVLSNRSHLIATCLSYEAAQRIRNEVKGGVQAFTLAQLPRYHFVADVNLSEGRHARPDAFLVRPLSVQEAWADFHCPEKLGALEEAITRNTQRRPVARAVLEAEALDLRLSRALSALPSNRSALPR
jgi:hypothetical protein